MAKTLCKTSKAKKRDKKMRDPRFECKKCGNQAREKKHLCKPQKTA